MLFEDTLIIDDAVPVEIQDKLEAYFTSTELAWTYNHSSLYIDGALMGGRIDFPQTPDTIDVPMLSHIAAFNNKEVSVALRPAFSVIEKIPHDMTRLLRVKANITFPHVGATHNSHQPVHQDAGIAEDYLVGIYYVNDSDGDTFIFDATEPLTVRQRISPKKGRLVVFNGKYLHAGGIPSKNPRVVININGF
jgi:hypothetical protein